MAKKKKQEKVSDFRQIKENVIPIDICEISDEHTRLYVANVNILRQCAWVASGLFVGETRLLYALYNMKAVGDKIIKASRVVGEVIGRYHPHGDASSANTLTRLAQSWKCNYPLITIKGQEGGIDGSKASAARYLEARLSDFAVDCFFSDFDKNVVDMRPTYTRNDYEPEFVLPAKVPYILVNNTFGIGKGASSSMYGCNLIELIDLTKKLMDNPNLKKCVLYPDIASGADVIDEGQFEEICEKGSGSYVTRAKIDVDEKENKVTIRAVPLFTVLNAKASDGEAGKDTMPKGVSNRIAKLISDNKLPEIIDIIDNSSQLIMEFSLILKKGTDPYKFRDKLYKLNLGLQESQSVSMTFIDNYQDGTYNLRGCILTWLEYRRDYKRRILHVKIVKGYERAHKLKILVFITNKANREKTVEIMGSSKNRQVAEEKLIKTYKITSLQAKEISEMPLHRFTKDSHDAYVTELKELEKEILPDLEAKVRSNLAIDNEIKEELNYMAKTYGRPRKSRILKYSDYQTVIDKRHTIVISNNGYVKKMDSDVTEVGKLEDGDFPIAFYNCDNSDEILLFSNKGFVYNTLVSDIPGCSQNSIGNKLSNIGILKSDDEKIIEIKRCPIDKNIEKLKKLKAVFITKNGLTKKTTLDKFISSSKCLIGIQVKPGDELMAVKLMEKEKELIVYTSNGMGIRTHSKLIQESSRQAMGSRCISLSDDDSIIGFDYIDKSDIGIIVITEKGLTKLVDLSKFPATGKEPLRISSLNDNDRIIKMKTVNRSTKIGVILRNGRHLISVSDLEFSTRLSKGKKTIPVKRGDVIIDAIIL